MFRKYVDFGAISALAKIHEMIRAETARKEAVKDRGTNIKLGSGGIREIEFICQTFQIIRGGREAELRGKTTGPMLKACAASGCIDEQTAERLNRNYVFLRNLEHCLQYVDDKQTQVLPKDDEERSRVAKMMGLTLAELDTEVAEIRAFVTATFDGVFHTKAPSDRVSNWPVGWSTGDPGLESELTDALAEDGFVEANKLAGRILKMMRSRYLNARTQQTREQLARFVPKVAKKAAGWAQLRESRVSADEVMERYLSILEMVLGRATYIALLNQYPDAADRVGRMLAVSRWAADYIAAHPLVLDELVDARNRVIDDYTPVDRSRWLEELRAQMRAADGDRERQLNHLRDAHHSALFQLLTADLEGRLTVERLADQPIDMMEINISCPNVNAGFLAFGQDAHHVEELTAQIKKIAKQPVIMKLTPNVTDITEIAKGAEAGGADAVSLINTLTGMKIDINRKTFALANKTGGVSGPIVKPIAVRMVYQVAQAVNIPIIGMGGISCAEDAIEFILAGASAVSVGTANFHNPAVTLEVIDGIEAYMKKNGFNSVKEMVGIVK